MRPLVGALVLFAAFTNSSGMPIYRQPEQAKQQEYRLSAQLPMEMNDECSRERRQAEKVALNREYFISRDTDNNINLLPRGNANRKFVFDIYQEQADASNWYDGVLACYEGPVGNRWLATSCNIVITPCQKA